jgi:hypothetical protein
MITMYFIRMWFRWVLGSVLALVVERGLLGLTWWFALAALVTLAVLAGVTALMYGDWRSARQAGSGYRYDIFRDITRH